MKSQGERRIVFILSNGNNDEEGRDETAVYCNVKHYIATVHIQPTAMQHRTIRRIAMQYTAMRREDKGGERRG